MKLDPEAFTDWQDRGIRIHKPKSQRFHTDENRPVIGEDKKQLSPEVKIENRIRFLETKLWADLPEEERASKLKGYYDWVRDSLKDSYPSMKDADLHTEVTGTYGKYTKVTHVPTGYFGLSLGIESDSSRLLDAKDKLDSLLTGHLRQWENASDSFRKSHKVV